MEKVLIIGLGKSGMGSARLLAGKAALSVYDAKEEDKISAEDIKALKEMDAEMYFGKDPEGEYDTLVLSPAVPLDNPVALKYGQKAEIIGELELAYRHCRGEFIGITGTNGKTTTTTLVGEIIKAAGFDSRVVGNIGNAVSEECEGASENTLMITEISSFQLETIKDFHPHISAILNLTPDHLDRHKSFDGYIAAKKRITENQTLADFFIYNASDPETFKLAEGINNVNKVPFSADEGLGLELLENSAFVQDGFICVKAGGRLCRLCKADALQIPGKHNLENALAAAAICIFAEVPAKIVSKVLRMFKGVEHRLEFVREYKGVRYINDSKGTNPDASVKALDAMPAPIILIAGGYDKKLEFDEYIKAFDNKVEYLLLLGETSDKIAETARKYGFPDEHIIKFSTLSACVAGAAKLAQKGDTVLLSPACASWGMFDNYEQRGDEFKRLVKEL